MFTPMLTQFEVYAEVRERYGVKEISDGAARTIASWWQAPCNPGFTKLASGMRVTVDEISRDIASEYPDVLGLLDEQCLDMLGTWAIHKARATEEFRDSLTPKAQAETRKRAVEEIVKEMH